MEDPSPDALSVDRPDTSGTAEFRPPATPRERGALLAALLLGILATAAARPFWAGSPRCLAVFGPAAALGLLLLDRRGVTTAGPDGIVNERFGTVRRTPWREVAGFEVRGTRSGRVVRVLRRDGRPLTLAAPVNGPLARDPAFGERLRTLQTLAAAYRHAPPGLRERSSRRIRPRTALLTLLALVPPAVSWTPWPQPW
ncbi:hypothetical protein GCM10010191_35130 [Actinomadura vinacea]|uniref:PH domain-containing protein n=1 Tax=Actinomadura vinacea TaxID=115336 RepID=A0ABN3J444_9ACTN